MTELMRFPSSREEILLIQRERKRIAFERAKQAPWYRNKLSGIDVNKLDDPEVWSQVPILTKDILRRFDHDEFIENFNIAPTTDIAEYWRSGGTTGKPVFYPRTFEDVNYGLESWARTFPAIGIDSQDLCHISFPLGIHPAGQIWARSAHQKNVGMNWVGAGNSVPSEAQIDLILTLKPTVLISMSSFALHLANIADNNGIDLSKSSVRIVICSAETLSDAKREKLGHRWGAEVFDVFGMSEAGLMGCESSEHDGIHIWSDMYYCEVIDEKSSKVLNEGETGAFCVTPLFTNNATPFLRWNSGDIVQMIGRGKSKGRIGDLFPMIRHAARTTGFFKIRGVNLNHTEFEDFMFGNAEINDFQAILETGDDDLELIRVKIEVKRGLDEEKISKQVGSEIKKVFEVSPIIDLQKPGELAKLFETSIKAPRFVDERR
ncbi:MAG: AMP-binding protein [Pseudomonadota bacterium]|nr:AMP-binding protein [Pseudomonadota bacterium]